MIELIKGKNFNVSPAPKALHQEISMILSVIIGQYFGDKECKVFHAPFDVVLPVSNQNKNKSTSVVQPDLCLIFDMDMLDDAGCFGSPNLIIEILSDSTSKKRPQ